MRWQLVTVARLSCIFGTSWSKGILPILLTVNTLLFPEVKGPFFASSVLTSPSRSEHEFRAQGFEPE